MNRELITRLIISIEKSSYWTWLQPDLALVFDDNLNYAIKIATTKLNDENFSIPKT